MYFDVFVVVLFLFVFVGCCVSVLCSVLMLLCVVVLYVEWLNVILFRVCVVYVVCV